MHFQNRWHGAKFEATGAPCDVVAVYFNGEGGPQLSRILLADGRTLERVEKGRYLTLWNQIVISADPEAP